MSTVEGTAFLVLATVAGVGLLPLLGFAWAAIRGMRCPRCGARVTWLGSGWDSLRQMPPRRLVLCFRCRSLRTSERRDGEWVEIVRRQAGG